MGAAPNLIVVPLRHPLLYRRGDSTYARGQIRAASAAGFHPWVVFPHHEPVLEQTPYATFEGVRSVGLRWMARLRPAASILAAMFAGSIVSRIVARAAPGRGPIVVHGIGIAAYGAVLATRRLEAGGRRATALANCYTSLVSEYAAKLMARGWAYGRRQRLRAELELRWVERFVVPREAVAYEGASWLLVNYRSVEREARQRWPRARCRVVPYASDRAFLDDGGRQTPAPGPPFVPEIVTVAWHDPRKGLETLLRALALLRDRGGRFSARLVGGGALLPHHRRFANQLDLDDHVRFVADASDSFAHLRRADIFALVSFQEGSGSLALLEAMQAGLAPVVSAVDGLVEDVADEVNGLLVPPADPPALAAALFRLVSDPALRRRLGDEARRTFERRFSGRGLADSLTELYGEAGLRPASLEPNETPF